MGFRSKIFDVKGLKISQSRQSLAQTKRWIEVCVEEDKIQYKMNAPKSTNAHPATTNTALSLPRRTRKAKSAEEKRKFRARKPEKYHDRERAKARVRMRIQRDKNRAQSKVKHLRNIISNVQCREVEESVAELQYSIIRDWFKTRRFMWRRSDSQTTQLEFMRNVGSKLELNKIDLQLLEFEILTIEQKRGSVDKSKNNDTNVDNKHLGAAKDGVPGDKIDDAALLQILGHEYDKVLTNAELENFIREEIMPAVNGIQREGDGNAEISGSGVSNPNNVRASDDGGEVRVDGKIHDILQMDVVDFEVKDLIPLGMVWAGCFDADKFEWEKQLS